MAARPTSAAAAARCDSAPATPWSSALAGVRSCDAGEDAGLELPNGCRMGICHTCVGRLRSGRVRDLRTGEIHGGEDETVRTCVNAPEGEIEIDL